MGTERKDMPMSDNMSQAMTMARRGLSTYGGGGSSYGTMKDGRKMVQISRENDQVH